MAIAFNAAQFKKTVQAQKPKAESLTARTEIQQESKTVFDLSKAPYPIKRYAPKEGVNWFDVVGFYLDNPETPDIVARDKRVGEFTYGIRAFTHRGNQSSNFTPHLCLKRNYGRKCPRCDEYFLPPEKGGTFVKGAQGSGNQDHASSDRLFLLVVPRESKSVPGNHVELFDAPMHDKFGFPILSRAVEMGNGEEPVFFWYPTEEGRTVQFEAAPGKMKGAWDFSKLMFLPRPEEVGIALAEKFSFPLDSLLIVPTEESMNRDLFGGSDSQQSEDSQSHGAQEAHEAQATREPEEAMDPDAFGAPEAPKAAQRQDDEAPAKAPSDPAPVPGTDKVPTAAKGACPYGHTFGADYSRFQDCRKCGKENPDSEASCLDAG